MTSIFDPTTALTGPTKPKRKPIPARIPSGPEGQLLERGNIDLNARPVVSNPDGSYSTVRSITVGVGDGRYALIPTVVGDKVVSNKAAIANYHKTGEHLGVFTSEKAADTYAQTLHEQQASQYTAPFHPPLVKPTGPPVRPLIQLGFGGTIDEFNQRVQQIHDQAVKTTGVAAPPAQVLQQAVAPGLLGEAQTKARVAYEQAHTFVGGGAPSPAPGLAATPPPLLTQDEILGSLKEHSISPEAYHRWLDVNGDSLYNLLANPATAPKAISALNTAKAQAFSPSLPGLAAGQIASSLAHAPGGLILAAQAFTRDVDAANPLNLHHFGEADLTFQRTTGLGEAIARQYKQDFTNPSENPGFLFLDLLGIASLGYGTALRAGRASAAAGAAAEEGAGLTGQASAAARGFRSPHPLQTIEVSGGEGYTENMLLSSNPLVAATQKRIVAMRQRAADERAAGVPNPVRSILMPDEGSPLRRILTTNLSFERKVGREADARKRVEHIADMSLAHDLEKVAGASTRITAVNARLKDWYDKRSPEKRAELTVGENKAIQAESWDIEGTLLDKIKSEQQFHERMIAAYGDQEGPAFVQNHQRQLLELQLAKDAVANPSDRFIHALDLTRQVSEEGQRLRIEKLGLAPLTAENRIAKTGAILRGESIDAPLKRQSKTSFYLHSQKPGKVTRPPSTLRGFQPSQGPFGSPPGRLPSELTHEMRGDAIISGDFRTDAANLATEAYARTVRAIAVRTEHDKLWRTGQKTAAGIPAPYQRAVRDINKISDEHRAVVAAIDRGLDSSQFTDAELALLPQDMRLMIEDLYPDVGKLTEQELKNVRWQDSRRLGENSTVPHIPGLGAEVMDFVNAPIKFSRLFLRPAYYLNKIQNRVALVLDEGFFNSLENVAKATNLEELYGETNANMMRALTGHGHARSYATSSSGKLTRSFANWWSRWTDRDERVASFLYYADRKGYKTPEEVDALLNNEAHAADKVEVSRRANKALVEFDNLTPIEKDYLRHAIFVYPWIRGSAVWSLRSIMEHPQKVAILSHLGRQALQNDPILDRAVEWYKRVGYFPLGFDGKGNPMVGNPTSMNAFTTWQDLLSIAGAQTGGDRYAAAGDVAGPAVEFGIHALTGRDRYGNTYPGSQFWGAASDVLFGLPQLIPSQRKTDKPLKPFNVTDRASLEARINSALGQSVFTPGWLGGYGQLLIGGFSPRGVNRMAMTARYWRDASDAYRHKWSLDLLQRAAKMQGTLLGRPVPKDVQAGIQRGAELSYRFSQHLTETGRGPTAREKADMTLAFLPIPAKEKAAAEKTLKTLVLGSDIDALRNDLFDKYGGGAAVKQWDEDVRVVASFNKESFNYKAGRLFAQGLSPQRVYNVPQEKLTEYGRQYLLFTEKVKKMAADIHAGKATAADMRVLIDENATPKNRLPSFAALAWAHRTPAEQAHALLTMPTKGWGTLTAVDKALVGKPVDPAVTEAWAAYSKLTSKAALAKQLPLGSRTLDRDQRLSIVKQIDRYYNLKGKFLQDWLFAHQPVAKRLSELDVYKDSKYKNVWHDLLARAIQLRQAVVDKKTTAEGAADAWRGFASQLPAYYKENYPRFWRDDLEPLLEANPRFLGALGH